MTLDFSSRAVNIGLLADWRVGRASEHTREDYTSLCICMQDLVPLVAMEIRYLQWCHTQRRPTGPSEPDSLITSRLVYIDRVIPLKVG